MKQFVEYIAPYKIYNVCFSSITDLYNYIKGDPPVNTNVFSKQESLTHRNPAFYGESLNKATEYLLGGYEQELNNFLIMLGDLNKKYGADTEIRTLKRGLFGGVPLAPLVAAGVPECMLKYERDCSPKSVNIYFNFSYSAAHDPSQIFNRGIATLYLVQALQDKGYIVNFKAFELSVEGDEVVNIVVDLKKANDIFLNVEKCYFPMVGKEFLRRILFRVMESIPVNDYNWRYGYGRVASANLVKQIYGLSSKDIIIDQPQKMNIGGFDIYDDTISMIKCLGLEEEFNMNKNKQKTRI